MDGVKFRSALLTSGGEAGMDEVKFRSALLTFGGEAGMDGVKFRSALLTFGGEAGMDGVKFRSALLTSGGKPQQHIKALELLLPEYIARCGAFEFDFQAFDCLARPQFERLTSYKQPAGNKGAQ